MRAWLLPGVALLTALTAAACTTTDAVTGNNASGIPLQDSYESVVRAVLPEVVAITTDGSTGSGVVYDHQGDIVTNAHVVGDAKSFQVLPATGGETLPATLVGVFKPDDLAVIRVTKDADKLRVATFGNSDNAAPGEIVLAMGNPLGLTDSVTQGIISATGRTVNASEPGGTALITAAIQTSAAINPGNSGGALVNLKEQVLGIPTLAARLPDQGGAAPGIGFAIPSNTVKNIANQLIKSGRVTTSDRATLGITAQTVANSSGQDAGVAVVAVNKGGPADQAGIKPGDIIIGVDNQATTTLQILEATLTKYKPGEKVKVLFLRSGSQQEVEATLGSLGS